MMFAKKRNNSLAVMNMQPAVQCDHAIAVSLHQFEGQIEAHDRMTSAQSFNVGRFVFVRLVAANTQCFEFMCCAAPFQTGDVHIQLLFQVLLFTFCCMLLLFSSIFGCSLFCDCRCCRQKFVRTNQFTTPSLNSSLSFAGLVSLMFFVIGVYQCDFGLCKLFASLKSGSFKFWDAQR